MSRQLEKKMRIRFGHVDARFHQADAHFDQADKTHLERFSSAKKIAAARHETARSNLAANHARGMNALDMDKRWAKLENERAKREAQHA